MDYFLCGNRPLSLIILAGGESRRMKRDKALLPFPEGTLIERIIGRVGEHFEDILISVSDPKKYDFLPYKLVPDERGGLGPMMGIKSALAVSRHEKNFIMACDIPDVDLDFLGRLIASAAGWDAAVPLSLGGRKEPMFTVYDRCVLSDIESLLKTGTYDLNSLLNRCRTICLPMEDSKWFRNLNTEEEYMDYMKKMP